MPDLDILCEDYWFVSIRDIAINKNPTRIPLNGLHDILERMLKINSPHHLQFRQLIGASIYNSYIKYVCLE